MWKSQADAAEEINGDRKNNNDIHHSMKRNDKENTTKLKVKGWYLFRDKKIALSDWKPAEPRKFTHEEAVAAGKLTKGISKPTFWKPIKGVNIQTGEIVKFNHASDAVKNLRSETCKVTQPGINKCCKHTEKGELTYTCPNWNGLYKPYQNGGYTWYYDIDVNKQNSRITNTMKPTPKETKKIHENYEKVVKHLIDEKYAVDSDSADKIISGMSQDWFDTIVG